MSTLTLVYAAPLCCIYSKVSACSWILAETFEETEETILQAYCRTCFFFFFLPFLAEFQNLSGMIVVDSDHLCMVGRLAPN